MEDYHLITEPRIHETLTFFLDHLPAQLHMVLLTRGTPPLPLARWRARGNGGALRVRPDGFVAWRAGEPNGNPEQQLERVLDQLLFA